MTGTIAGALDTHMAEVGLCKAMEGGVAYLGDRRLLLLQLHNSLTDIGKRHAVYLYMFCCTHETAACV